MDTKQFTPILPFDDTTWDNFQIYDSVVYVRDMTLLDDHPLKQHYPTMVKYYRIEMKEPAKIGGD